MNDRREIICESASAIGVAIRARRKELGYTQEQVAPVIGVSPRLLGEIERGRDTVGIGKVLRLCNVLGIDLCLKERD